MDPKVLAEALVEAGVLVKDETIKPGRAWKYYLPDYPDLLYGCVAAITDWRVAGALMEKVSCVELAVLVNMSEWQAMAFPPDDFEAFEVINESAPRAIIEACVAALEDTDD